MSSYTDLLDMVQIRPLLIPIRTLGLESQFSASWTATVKLLARELYLHGARDATLEVDFRPQDLRLDGLPRADRSARTPAIVLSFIATRVHGRPPLRYEVGTYSKWQDNMRAVALALERLRSVDRYGVTARGEQYAGWRQLPAGVGGHGDPNRGRVLVERAGSVAKALHAAHPDHGGEPDDFVDVIAYRDQTRAKIP